MWLSAVFSEVMDQLLAARTASTPVNDSDGVFNRMAEAVLEWVLAVGQ